MTAFVLDTSVAMRWLLASDKRADQQYAEAVLKSLSDTVARVPSLWHLEAANVLIGAENRLEIVTGEVERFISQLEKLPIQTDPATAHQALTRTLALARAYKLNSYDAAYLELALRDGLSLATLDKRLLRVAKKVNVDIYLKGR